MAIAMAKVERYLISKIDNDDHSAIEVVDRYIDLMRMFRRMQKQIYDDGPTVEIQNGEQNYVKAHPLINDMKNINAQMLNLKKDIDRYMKEYQEKLRMEAASKEYDSDELIS
ncbi:P27 family phage terminase small subunit [Salinicoccus halodurans]|uniref:Phage terminase, small subunit n=1 Tax=Salinicoccus halodurans TaxID=407035 RepID=A0AA94HIL8_9STAP|nr:P27 family phage terminase small subunit [Salinicoccus halodurans]SFK95087.1 Phage terminase, small subunit [Salinicoccus halodurans]